MPTDLIYFYYFWIYFIIFGRTLLLDDLHSVQVSHTSTRKYVYVLTVAFLLKRHSRDNGNHRGFRLGQRPTHPRRSCKKVWLGRWYSVAIVKKLSSYILADFRASRLSAWQLMKPRIWSIFDEPWTSKTARVRVPIKLIF